MPGSPLPAFQLPIHFPSVPPFLLHPSHLPTPTANGNFPPSHNPQHGNLVPPNDLALNVHVIPAEMCQGAGTCYYIAGICALERWQRFRRMVWEEDHDAGKGDDGAWSTLTQERKIDHAAQAIEVFTKAHEVFKRYHLQRQSLLVASKIAYAYVEAEQYEKALPFLERILKTFRTEGWPAQAFSLLLLTLESAQHTESAESEGRALWLLLALKTPLSPTQRASALEAMQAWQGRICVDEKKVLAITSNSNDGILVVESMFATGQVDLDDGGSLFQLRLSCPPGYSLQGVVFSTLQIYFTGQHSPFVVKHEDDSELQESTLINLGRLSLSGSDEPLASGSADLRWWKEGTVRALQGIVIPDKVGLLQIEKVCLQGGGAVNFALDFHPAKDEESRSALVQPRWMILAQPPRFIDLAHREEREGIVVQKLPHRVEVEIHHDQEAYLEESFPINVSVKNDDAVALQCFVEAAGQGLVQEESQDRLWIDGKETYVQSGKIEETELGTVQPGSVLSESIRVACHQHLRTRTIEVSIKTVIPGDYTEGRINETFHTVVIPVKAIFAPSFHASWRVTKDSGLTIPTANSRKPSITISDHDDAGSSEAGSEWTLSTQIDGDGQSTTALAAINVSLAVLAKEDIFIEAVSLCLNDGSKHLRGVGGASQDRHLVTELWMQGDRWGSVYDVDVLSENTTGFAVEGDDGSLRPTGQLQVEWRKEGREASPLPMNKAFFDVPLLLPPHLLSRIVVSIPSSTALEQPLVMLLSIVNPSKLSSEIFVSVDDAHSDFGILSHKTFTVPLIAKSTRSVPVHVLSKSTNDSTSLDIRHLPKVRAWQRDRRIKREEVEGGVEEQHRQQSTTPIMNQQRGGGLPLEVSLRYSKASSNSNQQSNGIANEAVAQLQAETLTSGLWTIFVHSHNNAG